MPKTGRQTKVFIKWNGEEHTVKEWSEITGLPKSCIYSRRKDNWPPELMFTTPAGISKIPVVVLDSHICEGCDHWKCIAQNYDFACHYSLDTLSCRTVEHGKKVEKCERMRIARHSK